MLYVSVTMLCALRDRQESMKQLLKLQSSSAISSVHPLGAPFSRFKRALQYPLARFLTEKTRNTGSHHKHQVKLHSILHLTSKRQMTYNLHASCWLSSRILLVTLKAQSLFSTTTRTLLKSWLLHSQAPQERPTRMEFCKSVSISHLVVTSSFFYLLRS